MNLNLFIVCVLLGLFSCSAGHVESTDRTGGSKGAAESKNKASEERQRDDQEGRSEDLAAEEDEKDPDSAEEETPEEEESVVEVPEEEPEVVALQFADVQANLQMNCGAPGSCHAGDTGLRDYVNNDTMLRANKVNVLNRIETLSNMPPAPRVYDPTMKAMLIEYVKSL